MQYIFIILIEFLNNMVMKNVFYISDFLFKSNLKLRSKKVGGPVHIYFVDEVLFQSLQKKIKITKFSISLNLYITQINMKYI